MGMKAMGAMKKKKVSIIAKGKLAKALVLRGSKTKTVGGLTASSLTKNKSGKVVSKAASARGKKAFKGSKLEAWARLASRQGSSSTLRASSLSEARRQPAKPCMPRPRPSTALEAQGAHL